MSDMHEDRRGWSWWYLLFALEIVVALWPPFYNKVEPSWIGLPFFYWFQLAWVLVGAIFNAIVYVVLTYSRHEVARK